jgi:CRISPR-associated endonuclease/helicase Cas3
LAEPYLAYWGKATAERQGARWHLLAYHSLDVAAVGAELLDRDLHLLPRIASLSGYSAESLRGVLPFLLALHDLGKFSEPFQDLRPEIVAELQGARPPRASELRHDTAGYLLWRSWAARAPDAREAALLPQLHRLRHAGGEADRRDLDDLMQSWMAAVLGHHGKPPEERRLPVDVFKARPDKPLARSRVDAAAFALAARELLSPPRLETDLDVEALLGCANRASWWLAGFTILCDWLGSDSTIFAYEAEPRSVEGYWATARRCAAAAVDRSGLAAASPRSSRGFRALFPGIACPTPLQRTAAEVELGDGPQLFVLEDLTGSGKTEAALILAHRLIASGHGDGLYFALPTMATANAMDGRIKPLLGSLFDGEPSYLLSHSGPRLTDRDRLALGGEGPRTTYGHEEEAPATRTASEWLSDKRKKALLADAGVGTIDQALLAVLQSKHAALRLFGLHRHVLVVDEVHACDAYMLRVLCGLLRVHAALGGSAVLLSATLPVSQRRQLAEAFAAGLGLRGATLPSAGEYPLLTGIGQGSLIERPVEPRTESVRTLGIGWHASVDAAVARVAEAARGGACACWIRNSVADAREAYEAVASTLGPENVTLFHARFALGDRLRIEQRVVERFGPKSPERDRRGHVVVATQVVEQSLDLDFDVMVTDLCPVDLVVQRAGRLQRHAGRPARPPPKIEILAPLWSEDPPAGWLAGPFRRTSHVYDDPAVLWRTLRELHHRAAIALPSDARALVEAVYGEDAVAAPASLVRRSDAAAGQALSHASVAQNAVLKLDLGYLRDGLDWSDEARTPTRLGEPSTTVRLARARPAGSGADPWFADAAPHLRWPLSQVSVARRILARADPGDDALRAELEQTQPFVGDDVVTVILRQQGDGAWSGRALAEQVRRGAVTNVSVRVVYSAERGLEVLQEGERGLQPHR